MPVYVDGLDLATADHVYDEGLEPDIVYVDNLPAWTRRPAPVINRFATLPAWLAAGAGVGTPVNFLVDVDNCDPVANPLTDSIVITDQFGTHFTYDASPAASSRAVDVTYTLVATNSSGSATAHYTLIRATAPTITDFTIVATGQTASGGTVHETYRVSWVAGGHPFPSLSWVDPYKHLDDPNRATRESDGVGAIQITEPLTPGGAHTHTLHLRATQPITGAVTDVTGTLTNQGGGG